jgi:class 3 adenylate cyclase
MARAPMAMTRILIAVVVLLVAGLPLAVWLDLRTVTEHAELAQAQDFNSVIGSISDFYADSIVGNVLKAPAGTKTIVSPAFELHPGAIPLPATLSLDLGNIVAKNQGDVTYRFISHYPFKGRAAHDFDAFENSALAAFEANPRLAPIGGVSWHGLTSQVRYVTPIVMGTTCVACHNADPASPKRDWKVGDIGGIQESTTVRMIAPNVGSFKFLLIYMLFAGAVGIGFILLQHRQAQFLESISTKLSRYLSPQIYRSIFSGATSAEVKTVRKKLTIFFSDIKDFTTSSERLQPEELTTILNEYFTEMSSIALAHGGTIDKFVGDAILIFFGDPESRGEAEDARACLRMAIDMQQKLGELGLRWRRRGIEEPFRVRMGINTGFCNVGNFGSAERIDYTIIGAEANLAARLQSIAEPGRIVISYETFALVRDIVRAHALEPIHVKGISREVTPYLVDGLTDESAARNVFREHESGLELFLDINDLDAAGLARTKTILAEALAAVDRKSAG